MGADNWMIYPAIDLRHGRVVRLMQGDPDRETAYASDPLHVAERWRGAGAQWVHVVNLDGAFGEGSEENIRALQRILEGTRGLRVQFGGGLRDLASVRRALELGVERVVLGTAAVRNPTLVAAALDAYGPKRVVIGIDAGGGAVRTHGWRESAGVTALELAQQWAGRGVDWLIFTDVARDGTERGLNLEATAQLAEATDLNVIASGGVASLDDVWRAYAANLSGVIIGRALYEGTLSLQDALSIADGWPHPLRGRRRVET